MGTRTGSGGNRHFRDFSGQTRCSLQGYPEVTPLSWPMSHPTPLHSRASLGHELLAAEQSLLMSEAKAMLAAQKAVDRNPLIIKRCESEQSEKLQVKPI